MSGLTNVLATGYCTISSTAKSLSDFTWDNGTWASHRKNSIIHAKISVEDADIRYWEKGTPTSTYGHLIIQGDERAWYDRNYRTSLDQIKFIRAGSTDAKVMITIYD
jgi:hypothetical protein